MCSLPSCTGLHGYGGRRDNRRTWLVVVFLLHILCRGPGCPGSMTPHETSTTQVQFVNNDDATPSPWKTPRGATHCNGWQTMEQTVWKLATSMALSAGSCEFGPHQSTDHLRTVVRQRAVLPCSRTTGSCVATGRRRRNHGSQFGNMPSRTPCTDPTSGSSTAPEGRHGLVGGCGCLVYRRFYP